MLKKQLLWQRLVLVILDLFLINFSYLITLMFRLGYDIPQYNMSAYLDIAPWISLMSILVFYIFNLYGDWIHQAWLNVLNLVFLAVAVATGLGMSLIYLTHNLAVPRTVTILNPIIELILVGTLRLIIWSVHRKTQGKKKVMILAQDENQARGIVKDFCEPGLGQYTISSICCFSDLKSLENQIKSINVDAVAFRANTKSQAEIINLCIKENREILIIPDIITILLHSAETRAGDGTLVFSLQALGISPAMRLVKRFFDLAFSIILLPLAGPVMLLIIILIYFTSPGEVFYRQERLGEKGQPFQLLKFRSMVNNAEDETGPMLALAEDPRITKIGSWLRSYHLDELPQLINVLRGEMSLVGPRPERKFFVEQFLEIIPYYDYRMAVKPGITGFAQVMGKYDTSPEDKLRFDLMYIRNYSFLLDLRILLLTLRVFFQKDKARGVDTEFTDAKKIAL